MGKCKSGCTCGRHKKRVYTAEERRKRSENSKRRWSDPSYRKRQSESIAKARRTDEYRERASGQLKEMWKSEEFRQNKIDGMKRRYEDSEFYQERLQKNIESHNTDEYKQAASERRKGKRHDHTPAVGFYYSGGYKILTMQRGHPLASRTGALAEHRKVLYDKIGPGTHNCHWCGCEIDWDAEPESVINADHLDGDRLNNSQENIVESCFYCNIRRGVDGNPVNWTSTKVGP